MARIKEENEILKKAIIRIYKVTKGTLDSLYTL